MGAYSGRKCCCHLTHSVTKVLASSAHRKGQIGALKLTLGFFGREGNEKLRENGLVLCHLQALVASLHGVVHVDQLVEAALPDVVLNDGAV